MSEIEGCDLDWWEAASRRGERLSPERALLLIQEVRLQRISMKHLLNHIERIETAAAPGGGDSEAPGEG